MSEKIAQNVHTSVLLKETVELLAPPKAGTFLDATLGMGGHAEAILTVVTDSKVIGIDKDENAIGIARSRLASFGDRVTFVHSGFESIRAVLLSAGHDKVDGVIADLGVSSLQLDSEQRGFSFRFDAPLDMRMDQSSGEPTAADLLKELSESEIADIIYEYGEERHSRRIARRIVEKRDAGSPVMTTTELVQIVERSVPRRGKEKIHPATRTFQALRIAVNREIEILEHFLIDAIDSLKPDGRIVIISFHSLEDRVVKQVFNKMSGKCNCPPKLPVCVCGATKAIEILTRKPVTPSDAEMDLNPRSRSAKLRAAKKI